MISMTIEDTINKLVPFAGGRHRNGDCSRRRRVPYQLGEPPDGGNGRCDARQTAHGTTGEQR